jgi:[FeFe] hydrogenase H-cluster maturation GTPase HydF
MNAMTRQQVSIVSPIAGTTTDPVYKTMELESLGPVVFMDTAGGDDLQSVLGPLRVNKMQSVFQRTDIGVLVIPAGSWGEFEEGLLRQLKNANIPTAVVFSKCDQKEPNQVRISWLEERGYSVIRSQIPDACPGPNIDRHTQQDKPGVPALKKALLRLAPHELFKTPAILGDLVPAGSAVVLVVPIDAEAPSGRIILPQVQTIRDLLDHACTSVVCRDTELADTLNLFDDKPAMVVTDSQAFLKVAQIVPADVMLTSFSILFARIKGKLMTFVKGADAIDHLKKNDRILIAESCTHHPIADDIGTVKIPRLLEQRSSTTLDFHHVQGHDFPADLSGYSLVIHCGGCMTNRREILNRIDQCERAGTQVCNYGMAIAHCLGIIDRALSPFPGIREHLRQAHEECSPLE